MRFPYDFHFTQLTQDHLVYSCFSDYSSYSDLLTLLKLLRFTQFIQVTQITNFFVTGYSDIARYKNICG